MRKNTLVTMAVVTTMSLSLAACNRSSASDTAAGGTKSATLVISTLNNPFFVSVADGAKAKAKTLGMTIDVQNANNADQASLDLASAALNKKPSVLIIDPVSSASGGSIVTLANTGGVPVVAFDRMPESGDLKAFIGYDAIQAGKNGAKAMGEALGGRGKIVEIQGIMGTSVAQERSKGFNEGIKAFPGIKIVATQPAEFDRGKALNVMTNVLQSNRDIDGVYAANDEMALGVIAALKAAGLTAKVKVVGNDGIADAVKAIKDGTLYATNAESPFALGSEVMALAAKVANGEQVEKKKVLQGFLVKSADVPSYCKKLADLGDTATCK
ncbi:MAG TPA: sugar ABC transporter substrate-binding protein [Dermatophilaceae bacterium]|nr:sugar ABC transporter substrate-binding protein [Dermatophilaceae bacterium]